MRHHWADLLFLHWPVPTGELTALLPPGLELDTFEGQAYVGLVPFTMTGVRPVWTPAYPPLSNFHETNVRTYVHRSGLDPGVWFFSLDAANALAVRLARAWYGLPYHFARMTLERRPGAVPSLQYESERLWPGPLPGRCSVTCSPHGEPAPAAAGTLDAFLVERYLLYSFNRDRLGMAQVHHSPYPLQRAEVHSLDESLLAAAGIRRPDTAPLVHYAREVSVRVYSPRRA